MQTHTAEVKEVRTAGFMKRNANKERIEQEEKEMEELLKAQRGNEEEEQEEDSDSVDDGREPEGAEEKTFKKRYGDLRRHAQKKEQDLQKQIDELRTQLEASTKKEIKYPKSEEELGQWMTQYPDVAKIVETIAMKKAHEQASEFESKFKQIDEMKAGSICVRKRKLSLCVCIQTLIPSETATSSTIGLKNNLSGYKMHCTTTTMTQYLPHVQLICISRTKASKLRSLLLTKKLQSLSVHVESATLLTQTTLSHIFVSHK
jgi:hypothetical protein